MKRGKTRPFTAPRASKPVQTGHRKDNAEWGKRMERELAQIEKKQISVETNEKSPNVGAKNNGKGVQLNSQTEADEIWNKGQCVITNRVASRKKYNARYFFSRMKALNVATIPEFKEGRLNAPAFNDELFRQREWNFFTTRVQIYSY